VAAFFAVGVWFLLMSAGFARKSRLADALTTIPTIAFAAIFCFVLLFAPLSWGDQGTPTAYLLQGISLLIIILEVLGLISVLTRQPS
jgi:hypothetical protein